MKRIISLGMIAVFLATLMTEGTLPALAKGKKGAKDSVSGTVVHGKSGKGVEGAHVHVKHKHKSHSKSSTPTAPKNKGAAKKHSGVTTGKGGSFTLKTSGSGKHTIVAHKKGVGSGHASVSGKSSGVTIKLHKHHHSHSKTATKPETK